MDVLAGQQRWPPASCRSRWGRGRRGRLVDRAAEGRAAAQPGERANASLETWRIMRKFRCCPWRARATGQSHPRPSGPRDRRM